MARRRRPHVQGLARTRALVRRLPQATRDELGAEMRRRAPGFLAFMRGRTPRRLGGLRAALGWRFYPRTLRLRVGLIGRAAQRRHFYGHILETGRKGGTVRVRRRAGAGRTVSYTLRVRPFARDYAMKEATLRLARRVLRPALGRIYERALLRAGRGA